MKIHEPKATAYCMQESRYDLLRLASAADGNVLEKTNVNER